MSVEAAEKGKAELLAGFLRLACVGEEAEKTEARRITSD